MRSPGVPNVVMHDRPATAPIGRLDDHAGTFHTSSLRKSLVAAVQAQVVRLQKLDAASTVAHRQLPQSPSVRCHHHCCSQAFSICTTVGSVSLGPFKNGSIPTLSELKHALGVLRVTRKQALESATAHYDGSTLPEETVSRLMRCGLVLTLALHRSLKVCWGCCQGVCPWRYGKGMALSVSSECRQTPSLQHLSSGPIRAFDHCCWRGYQCGDQSSVWTRLLPCVLVFCLGARFRRGEASCHARTGALVESLLAWPLTDSLRFQRYSDCARHCEMHTSASVPRCKDWRCATNDH